AFSVSLWVKNGATGQNQYASVFCNRHPSGGDSFQIDMGDGFRYNGGTKASFGTAPVGTWVHLVVASDGTDTKLYYNGTLAATLTGISNGVFEGFYLGVNRNGNKHFNGSVKDVRLYDREVDITEFYPAP
ncbi:Concanavalin A-like lectin/glucanases superfamily protein, partial [Rubritalea squalenifaciens DSM 18772]